MREQASPAGGWLEALRRATAVLGFAIAAVFGAGLLASFVNPMAVELAGRELIRAEVQRRVGERIEALGRSPLGTVAGRLVQANEAQIAALRRQLAAALPERVGQVVAEMRNADCACRKAVARWVREGLEGHVGQLARINERLTELIRGQYLHTAAALLREFRIFSLANGLAFLMLGAVAVLRPRARAQLMLPAALLALAAVGVAWAYLFGQNWLHTLVFGDYLGWGYLAWLGGAFAGLLDIVFNRARVSTWLLNRLADALGTSVQALPC
ncbi:MAG: hypothetical protein HY855_22010 [Burkholderiales bacterium]|nr:hypothetical protein [Burkholderiales bacterium]